MTASVPLGQETKLTDVDVVAIAEAFSQGQLPRLERLWLKDNQLSVPTPVLHRGCAAEIFVVRVVFRTTSDSSRAFLYDNGTMIDLGMLND